MTPVASSVPVRVLLAPQTGSITNCAQTNKKRVRSTFPGAGSASDVDGAVGSGGEVSESGKSKKLKLNPPSVVSQGETPQRSRAGSPTSVTGRNLSGSRASSPESLKGTYHPFQYCFKQYISWVELAINSYLRFSCHGP